MPISRSLACALAHMSSWCAVLRQTASGRYRFRTAHAPVGRNRCAPLEMNDRVEGRARPCRVKDRTSRGPDRDRRARGASAPTRRVGVASGQAVEGALDDQDVGRRTRQRTRSMAAISLRSGRRRSMSTGRVEADPRDLPVEAAFGQDAPDDLVHCRLGARPGRQRCGRRAGCPARSPRCRCAPRRRTRSTAVGDIGSMRAKSARAARSLARNASSRRPRRCRLSM